MPWERAARHRPMPSCKVGVKVPGCVSVRRMGRPRTARIDASVPEAVLLLQEGQQALTCRLLGTGPSCWWEPGRRLMHCLRGRTLHRAELMSCTAHVLDIVRDL